MSFHNIKLLIGIFILLTYIGIGVLGLSQFSHINEVPMKDCPYTQNSSAICTNSIDHANNWRQFSNVILSSFFIFSLLILGIILYFFDKQNFLNQKQYFYSWKYYLYNIKLYTSPDRIIEWLSLLENSPSFSYVRHS